MPLGSSQGGAAVSNTDGSGSTPSEPATRGGRPIWSDGRHVSTLTTEETSRASTLGPRAAVAQSGPERLVVSEEVAGSNPVGGATASTVRIGGGGQDDAIRCDDVGFLPPQQCPRVGTPAASRRVKSRHLLTSTGSRIAHVVVVQRRGPQHATLKTRVRLPPTTPPTARCDRPGSFATARDRSSDPFGLGHLVHGRTLRGIWDQRGLIPSARRVRSPHPQLAPTLLA